MITDVGGLIAADCREPREKGAARSILITGASSGFGKNVALALAQDGWRVFASMRDLAKGEQLRDEASAARVEDRISLLRLDVTEPAFIQTAVNEVLSATDGQLDALLSNAGYCVMGPFEELSDEHCRRQMETNFFGTLAVARSVIPTMREARRGRIVLVSSNAVNTPHPLMSMYAASKWALEGWAEAVNLELAPYGVDVRVVQPGAHRTPFAQNVVPALRPESPYRDWLEAVMPGLGDLDVWGRDPETATAAIVQAISENTAPFLTRIGEDSVAFSALKGSAPYEARAWAVRALVGVPAARAFAGESAPAEHRPILAEALRRAARAVERDPAQPAEVVAQMIARGSDFID